MYNIINYLIHRHVPSLLSTVLTLIVDVFGTTYVAEPSISPQAVLIVIVLVGCRLVALTLISLLTNLLAAGNTTLYIHDATSQYKSFSLSLTVYVHAGIIDVKLFLYSTASIDVQ
jgi:hypothetical protein